MTLHDNPELYKDAIVATSELKGIPEIYIEKDYWVTTALKAIFSSDIAHTTVFKGGTALSKCYGIIERFSEDIDLTILQTDLENPSQLKRRLKVISKIVETIIPEVTVEGITDKTGQVRKTVHSYPKVFESNFGQVREHIIVEASVFGSFEPHKDAKIDCFIAEMMRNTNQSALIATYNLVPFTIQVLSTHRTLCEKLMSLIRFSYSETAIIDLNNKIRHIYDIYKILLVDDIMTFFNSIDFEVMLVRVGHDDLKKHRENTWIFNHPSRAIIFSDINNTWDKLRNTYTTSFKKLLYGELPSEEKILETLHKISKRLEIIAWNLQ